MIRAIGVIKVVGALWTIGALHTIGALYRSAPDGYETQFVNVTYTAVFSIKLLSGIFKELQSDF